MLNTEHGLLFFLSYVNLVCTYMPSSTWNLSLVKMYICMIWLSSGANYRSGCFSCCYDVHTLFVPHTTCHLTLAERGKIRMPNLTQNYLIARVSRKINFQVYCRYSNFNFMLNTEHGLVSRLFFLSYVNLICIYMPISIWNLSLVKMYTCMIWLLSGANY
jgi:hypothetical protein